MKKYIAALFTALLLLCTALSAGAVGPALTTTELTASLMQTPASCWHSRI